MLAVVIGENIKSELIINNIKKKGIGIAFIDTNKHADIDEKILKENGIERADYLITLTDKDEDNLFLCKFAKNRFNVKHTISLVNRAGNIEFMKSEGIDFVVCENLFLSNSIEHFLTRGVSSCI